VAEELGGGFWAGLTLKPDQASFSAGEGALSRIASGLKSIGMVLAAYKLAEGMTRLAEAQSKVNVTSFFAAMDPQAMNQWSIMLKMAQVDVNSFVGSLTDLNAQFVRLQTQGDPLPVKTAKAIGLLGLDINKLMDMSGPERAQAIILAAQKIRDSQAAAQLVKDLLGQAGADYYVWLDKSHKSLQSQLDLSKGLNFQTPETTKAVMQPVADWEALKATFHSIATEISSAFMIKMNPGLKELLSFIVENKSTIKDVMDSFSTAFSTAGKFAVSAFLELGELLAVLTGKKSIGDAYKDLTDRLTHMGMPTDQQWLRMLTGQPPIEKEAQGQFQKYIVEHKIGLTPEAKAVLTEKGTPASRSAALSDAAAKAMLK
jgi:hypothetical protein